MPQPRRSCPAWVDNPLAAAWFCKGDGAKSRWTGHVAGSFLPKVSRGHQLRSAALGDMLVPNTPRLRNSQCWDASGEEPAGGCGR